MKQLLNVHVLLLLILEQQIFLFVFTLKIIFGIIFSFDKYYNFQHLHTFRTKKPRLKINQTTHYENMIVMDSTTESIADYAAGMYNYHCDIIDSLIVCHVFQIHVKPFSIMKFYKNYFLVSIKCVIHTIYINYDGIFIALETLCNAFNFYLLLIVRMKKARIIKNNQGVIINTNSDIDKKNYTACCRCSDPLSFTTISRGYTTDINNNRNICKDSTCNTTTSFLSCFFLVLQNSTNNTNNYEKNCDFNCFFLIWINVFVDFYDYYK